MKKFFKVSYSVVIFHQAHRIMDETNWKKSRKCVGINRLLLDGVYEAAYPLHDVSILFS